MIKNSFICRIKRILVASSSLLIIPLFFTVISDEFNWSFFDFIIMGFMMIFVGILFELVSRVIKSGKRKKLLYGLIILLFLLLWAELGVGIFNSPIAGD
tara:strand:+ start:2828 stop:3124 length:297 start_codon:yes stop_codon:yes gene_type:complete